MFACGTGSMRGPRVKTPLLLLLLLLGSLTGTVLSQSDGEEPEVETPEEEPSDPDEGVEDPIPTESDATSTTSSIPPEENTEQIHEEDTGSGLSRSFNPPALSTVEPDPESSGSGSTELPEDGGEGTEEDALNPIIILIPVVLVVIIIAMIVCGIFISRRLNRNRNQNLGKEDPYLDGSSTEKVPMPMFEEDVPSVLELEMEELDQWMKKDVEPVECNCN